MDRCGVVRIALQIIPAIRSSASAQMMTGAALGIIIDMMHDDAAPVAFRSQIGDAAPRTIDSKDGVLVFPRPQTGMQEGRGDVDHLPGVLSWAGREKCAGAPRTAPAGHPRFASALGVRGQVAAPLAHLRSRLRRRGGGT